jgi:sugar phosphate isomerase/epimerase
MEIKFFCPHWGSSHLDFKLFLKQVKNAGYDGVEMSLPANTAEKNLIHKMIRDNDLILIAQHWETVTNDFDAHKIEYRKRLVNLATVTPLFVNSQTGKDYFSFNQNAELIEIATEISQKYGVKIIHETHRGKFSFAAHVTADYLQKLPHLRLALDISHWCNVAESYLVDQQDAVSLAILRTDHIHSRVGFPEGPQIPDPRVSEWKEALQVHVGWWKRVVERKISEGQALFTISPEFGPFPYMTMLPFTRQPISNQWELNVFMKNLLKSVLES